MSPSVSRAGCWALFGFASNKLTFHFTHMLRVWQLWIVDIWRDVQVRAHPVCVYCPLPRIFLERYIFSSLFSSKNPNIRVANSRYLIALVLDEDCVHRQIPSEHIAYLSGQSMTLTLSPYTDNQPRLYIAPYIGDGEANKLHIYRRLLGRVATWHVPSTIGQSLSTSG